MISIGTFDNFNIAVAGVKGSIAPAAALIYETLMTRSQDEVATEYGLLAEAAAHPDDFAWVDLSASQGSPLARRQAGDAGGRDLLDRGAEEIQPDVRLLLPPRRQGREDRRARHQIHLRRARAIANCRPSSANCTVLPKHWWEGTDSQGRKRDISATTLEPPLGSGPYRIKEFVAGRSVTLERVKDYWGANLPAQVGQNNFDEMRFEFFRDNQVALEAFKADQADWIAENSAKQWATAYDFPAVAEKRVVKEEFPINDSGRMQGFAFNLRRDQFKDARLRRAFNYAFDFEEMNKQLFYGQYKRINSYFDGTELASSGLPEGQELQILETVRDKVPAEVFTTPYTQSGRRQSGSGARQFARERAAAEGSRLRGPRPQAGRRRRQAGHRRDPGAGSVLPSGSRCSTSRRWNASASPSSIRIVDDAQYQNRLRSFDFDIIIDQWGEVAVARQRAARILGIAGRRSARLAEIPSASRIRRSMR